MNSLQLLTHVENITTTTKDLAGDACKILQNASRLLVRED